MSFPKALALTLLVLCSCMHGAESFPLWDNVESVESYAKRVNLPPTQTLDLGNGVKLELVLIPAGKFTMGTPEHEKPWVGQLLLGVSASLILIALFVVLIRSRKRKQRPQVTLAAMLVLTLVASVGVWGGVRWNEALKHLDDDPSEHPAHEVTLTKPFYLGKYEVTQEQYKAILGTTATMTLDQDYPMAFVVWEVAQEFTKKVSETLNQTVRLPTEAEWEYACRAGTTTRYYSGDTEAELARVAWYFQTSKNTAHPVGQKEANRFGLYDMHGSVAEWCAVWYGVYPAGTVKDPTDPAKGDGHVLRGGSRYAFPDSCRSAHRFFLPDRDYRVGSVGFRIVLELPQKTP